VRQVPARLGAEEPTLLGQIRRNRQRTTTPLIHNPYWAGEHVLLRVTKAARVAAVRGIAGSGWPSEAPKASLHVRRTIHFQTRVSRGGVFGRK
jgi:hypothetical protein